MNWILIVVLGILIANALIGLKVGFIKTIFSLASMVVALILTVWFSPAVNDMLQNNEKFSGLITDKVEQMLSLEEKESDISDHEKYIEGLPLPKSIKNTLLEHRDKGINDLKDYIASYITGIIINSLAFILTFLGILVILWIVCFALNIISKLPILNQINKLTGMLAGVVHGLVIVWLLLILLTVFSGTKFGQDAFVMIEESMLLSLIYDNNFLLTIVISASKLLL